MARLQHPLVVAGEARAGAFCLAHGRFPPRWRHPRLGDDGAARGKRPPSLVRPGDDHRSDRPGLGRHRNPGVPHLLVASLHPDRRRRLARRRLRPPVRETSPAVGRVDGGGQRRERDGRPAGGRPTCPGRERARPWVRRRARATHQLHHAGRGPESGAIRPYGPVRLVLGAGRAQRPPPHAGLRGAHRTAPHRPSGRGLGAHRPRGAERPFHPAEESV